MQYTLTTYGAGETLAATFNAIAALIGGRDGTLYQPLVRFALLIGLVWMVASMVYGDRTRFFQNWVLPFYLMLTLFFAPTCTLHIHDPVTGFRHNVDHVPWGLGVVSAIISQVGDTLTRRIEMTFSLPDDLKYHKTGCVSASHLIAAARQFRITNSDLRETMQSFVNQCVVYDALIGQKYTFDDLKNAKDLWALVSAHPSPARSFVFKAPGCGKNTQIMTCAAGVRALEPYLTQQVENAFQTFESKIFGAQKRYTQGVHGGKLKQFLPGAFNYMTNMAKSASEHMMQQIMIHSVIDAIEHKSTELGNAPNFAVRRAYLQQRAHQETLAGIAAQKLLAMKNVMEALIYIAFIFLLPMALLPFGWRFITGWISLVMWVQLWPPLYAVLNFLMTIAVRSKGIGVIKDPAGSGITIANSAGFMDLHADMAAQAGFMSLAVGSLAYALVKGGAASFVHLASHMATPAVSAAASAADSLMSGNYSFGNVSQGSVAAYNTSFGQQTLSPSYASGSFQQNDGIVSRSTSAEGGHIVSVANSRLRSSVNFSESLSNSYTKQSHQAANVAKTQMVAATQAKADAYRKTIDFAQHQSESLSSGAHHGSSISASQNRSFTHVQELVDRFAHEHSLSKEDASSVMANAAASIGKGFGFLPLSVEGRLVGQKQWSSTERNQVSAAYQFAKQNNLQELFTTAAQATQDMKYSEMSEDGRRLSKSVAGSLEASNQYREEANKSLQRSQSYAQMATHTTQNATSINANMNQAYVGWLQNQALPHSSGAMGIREAETILSSRPQLNQQYQQRFVEEVGMVSSAPDVHPLSSLEQSYDRTHIDTHVSQQGLNAAADKATTNGLGDTFNLQGHTRDHVIETLSRIQGQISDQAETVEKIAKARSGGRAK